MITIDRIQTAEDICPETAAERCRMVDTAMLCEPQSGGVKRRLDEAVVAPISDRTLASMAVERLWLS